MWTWYKPGALARLLLLPLAALMLAANPPAAVKPTCDELLACQQLKAAGLESQAKGQLAEALEKLQAAYALSQDYRLQAPIGRVLQAQGKGDDAFAAFHLFLQLVPYADPSRATVEGWLFELLKQAPAEEPPELATTPLSPPTLPLPRCQHQKLSVARRASGGVLIGLGLLGFIPSAVLFSKQGSDVGKFGYFDGQSVPLVLDTRPAFVTGFALSAASLVSGTLVLALPAQKEKGLPPCRER